MQQRGKATPKQYNNQYRNNPNVIKNLKQSSFCTMMNVKNRLKLFKESVVTHKGEGAYHLPKYFC